MWHRLPIPGVAVFARPALCFVLVGLIAVPTAAQQFDRRAREEPEVVIEAGGRVGVADVVQFSPDGQFLFAAGDDKVVRVWPHSLAGLDTAPGHARTLRWRSWRDQLGGIKAIGISPDGKRVAIGGYGLKVSTVAILDRETGDTLAITWPRTREGVSHFDAVTAAAFHPDGKRIGFGTADGSLWLWSPEKLDQPENDRVWNAPVLAGRFNPDPDGSDFNFPRSIHFPDQDTLVSVAHEGQVLACDLRGKLSDDPTAPVPAGKTLFDVNDGQKRKYPVDKAVWTGDGKWLVVSTKGPLVLLRSADGKKTVTLELPEDHFARSLAVHQKTGTIAVGVASALPAGKGKPRFYMEANDEIWVYANPTDAKAEPKKLPHAGRAEALGFHPTEDRLAMAGGDADEITLLDLAKPAKPVSVVYGVGRRLFAVNLSENGEVIGVRTGRDPKATDPNDRATGPWIAFNVPRFTPTADSGKWVGVRGTSGGWEIVPSKDSRFVWFAEHAKADGTKERLQLQLDPDMDQAPTCYTFLPPVEGKPARVLVGHYYGCSLFELVPERAVKNKDTGERELPRSKLFVGHGAEVNSVVADKNGTWFVTAGADQTVAAWSLTDWQNEPALGGSFGVKAGQLVVAAVDVGSPAWEAGLTKDDRVERLAIGAKLVYDARAGKGVGTAEAAAALLAHPQSGVEYLFGWTSPGSPDRRASPTRIKQRPLWKWFPAFDEHGRLTDTIIWMWHGSYYFTASVHGDRMVGWHVNDADPAKTPSYQPLERYKHLFLRPDVISKLIGTRSVAEALKDAWGDNPVQKSFGKVESPPVEIVLKQTVVRGESVPLSIFVNRLGKNLDLVPNRVELWLNDHRFKVWEGKDVQNTKAADLSIPATAFRAGDNQITLIAMNPLRGRAEVTRFVQNPAKPIEPTLFGMSVGIDDYSAHRLAVRGVRALGDLSKARADATSVAGEFLTFRGKGKYFPSGDLAILLDAKAGRAGLTVEIARLKAANMKPDDLLVVFLAGHGDLLSVDGKVPPPPPMGVIAARGLPAEAGRFVFCCPDYSPRKASATALSAEELFDALADINCRKLVLLDACHAGGATETNLLRRCIPNGQGPVVFAACDQSELSFEDDKLGHGVFTSVLLEALGNNFRAADANSDGSLSAAELYDYLTEQVPEKVSKLRPGNSQHPICFPEPSVLPKVPLVKK
jgi:WD40 repeat protein